MRPTLAILALIAAPALAQEGTEEAPAPLPPVSEQVGYSFYIVQGPTLEVIGEVMAAKGPGGGENLWQVSATPDCAVSLSATLTLPKLIGTRNLAEPEVAAWENMLDALEAYQQSHVAIGREAAQAVRAARCEGPDGGGVAEIVAPFVEKSRELDTSTEGGRTVGVTLELPDEAS